MVSGSIVKRSFAFARRCIFMALLGAGCIIICLLIERTYFQTTSQSATKKLVEAYVLTSQILIADERLTLSANMAVSTGERHWVERYQKNIPIIERAINRALQHAPQNIADLFDKETRLSNEKLIALEGAAFEALQSGDRDKARHILSSPEYLRHKAILVHGTSLFVDSIVNVLSQNLAMVGERSRFLLFGIFLVLFIGGCVLLWQINKSLNENEDAYLKAENKIRFLANNDVLTGMANRLSLQRTLQEALVKAEQHGRKLAVLMMDLDRFKLINDRYGHGLGDMVLKEAAERMGQVLDDGEFYSRYGGDEFVILIEYKDDEQTVLRKSKRLIESLSQVMTFEDISVQIGASVGIAYYPDHADSDVEIMRKADLAVYRSKENGRSQYQVYDHSMDEDLIDRTLLESELRDAIANDEIVPFFQPIICLNTGRIKGFEILSRWRHPTRGLLSPDKFIPLIESMGCHGDLAISILHQACSQAEMIPGDCFIAINIAPQDIQDEWFVERILTVLHKTGFPPHRLEVELTENALIRDLQAAKNIIRSLKNIGVGVSLDDFGTGYSSLYYLSELTFDKLKIDRSFVSSMHNRVESKKIIQAIIGLGSSLNIPTVAEGIETEAQAIVLHDMGCPNGQGFLYSKPVPIDEIADVINRLGCEPEQALSA